MVDGTPKSKKEPKWADRPWFAVLSAVSLVVGIVIGALGVIAWIRAAEQERIYYASQNPRLEVIYLQVNSNGFAEGRWKEAPLLLAPWVRVGVFEQIRCEEQRCNIDSYFQDQAIATANMFEERLGFSAFESIQNNLFLMRLENRGGNCPKRVQCSHANS
jgi:hypothetical protein